MKAIEFKEPDGWFLHRAVHQHTEIRFRGDMHTPAPYAQGPWLVEFQAYPTGGLLTSGRGKTLAEAWRAATLAVLNRHDG